MRHIIILVALWSLLLPATSDPAGAEPYFARNKLRVFETADPGVMEVLAQPGSAGAQFFCAAGEYARGPLGARSTDRVVVVAPASRSADPRFRGQRTVKFALVPRGTPLPRQSGVLLSVDYVGENRSVGHAQFLCNQERRGGRLFD